MSIPPRDTPRRPMTDTAAASATPWRYRPFLSVALLLLLSAAACDPQLGVEEAWGARPLPSPGHVADTRMADVGAELFRRNCVACHSLGGGSLVGPDLEGVTLRRSQPWIRGMVAQPDSMIRVDSIAQALLAVYQVPMLNRELDPARVRAILEFLWRADHLPEVDER